MSEKVRLPAVDAEAFEADLSRSVRRGQVVSLAVLDVDNLLSVNEKHGREVGDRVLALVAKSAAEEAGGTVYRVAADEFAVLMPEVSLEQAFLRMERLRSRVQSLALPDGAEVTVSIGVAEFPRDAKDAQTLRQVAEAAMFSAKEAGGNRISLAPSEEMVMKSSYYPAALLRRLKALAERLNRTESQLLREALSDLLRKYDRTT